MSKGEVDTPNQHKISMPDHENGTARNNNDDHASSRTDNNNLYMTSASKVDALDAGAKFVLESKGSTLLHMPQGTGGMQGIISQYLLQLRRC
jgi:hypothetical protein